MDPANSPFVFPKWTNLARPSIAGGAIVVPLYLALIVTFGFSPMATDVGYQPVQPVPYSHALHAGELGMDCRYCHVTVERTSGAYIPPTQTCMNCHTGIRTDSARLAPVRESYKTGMPVEWVRVHDLPDYAYFNHSAHVRRGVGCVECHGRIDRMETVFQFAPLSMSWCLECHRNPESRLRPLDQITNMTWQPDEQWKATGVKEFMAKNRIQPSTDCSTCHR